MPKDFIHFKIARRAAERLEGTRFATALAQHEDALLLGSVFHDALFYAVMPKATPLERLSHALHGKDGQDTFAIIRLQASHAGNSASPMAAAILVGLISHLYADAVIHPLVWHLSGHYYDDNPLSKSQARQRHRALESLMDMVACPEMMGRARYRLNTLLRHCPDFIISGIPVAEIGDLARMMPQQTAAGLSTAWKLFAALQWTYSLPRLAQALFALRNVLPRRIAEIGMLFYAPQLLSQAEALQNRIDYVHPLTDRPLKASLEQLMNAAAAKAAGLCRQLEASVFEEAPLHLPGPGPSMDSGMAGQGTSTMHTFANPPFPSLD